MFVGAPQRCNERTRLCKHALAALRTPPAGALAGAQTDARTHAREHPRRGNICRPRVSTAREHSACVCAGRTTFVRRHTECCLQNARARACARAASARVRAIGVCVRCRLARTPSTYGLGFCRKERATPPLAVHTSAQPHSSHSDAYKPRARSLTYAILHPLPLPPLPAGWFTWAVGSTRCT